MKKSKQDFPGGTVDKNPPANAGDMGSILVWEDSPCHWATKPMCHNYWAHILEPASCNWAWVWQLLKPVCLAHLSATKNE